MCPPTNARRRSAPERDRAYRQGPSRPTTHTCTRQASRHQYRRRVGDRPPQPASESRHWFDHPIDCTPLAMPEGCKGRLPRRICPHANASVSTSWAKSKSSQ
ncbi:hypothetical protein BXU03_11040 [Xanthomonas oryzae pv. oryzae]|nr:hypothetical protein BXU03_11040 [Xanthomonas oryzae pv. oryzae]